MPRSPFEGGSQTPSAKTSNHEDDRKSPVPRVILVNESIADPLQMGADVGSHGDEIHVRVSWWNTVNLVGGPNPRRPQVAGW